MLRSSLALILVCACAPAMAQGGRDVSADACHATEASPRAAVDDSGAAPPKSSVTRSRYARPTATPSGGSSSDDLLPRARGSKWHSFLPGMFR